MIARVFDWKTLEFQLREEDLNALFRGPEPRVLTATLSRDDNLAGIRWTMIIRTRGYARNIHARSLFVKRSRVKPAL